MLRIGEQGGSGGGGGGDGPFNTHWVWVSISGGSDATGDGTVNKPFASIGAAVTSITDNSSANHYQILVAPGTYVADGLTLKSWVNIVGLAQYGTVVTVDSIIYDPGYDASGSAPTSIQNLILSADPVLTGSSAIHNPAFIDCLLQDGLTLTGAASFSPWGCVIAALGATITDVFSVFSRTNSWEGAGVVTFASATLGSDAEWDADQDRFLSGITVTSSSGQTIGFGGDGDLEGPVTLNTTHATFEGTATFCGTSLVLSGGALLAQYTLDGGGNASNGQILMGDGAGHIVWTETFPNATGLKFATTGLTPPTTGRLNFCGDASQTWIAWHYNGSDLPILGTDGVGDIILGGIGNSTLIVEIDTAIELANVTYGTSVIVEDGVYVRPGGVQAFHWSSDGTGSGLGIQSVNVPIANGANILTLGQGIVPGIQLSGALTGAASVVFGDAPGLYFVDTSQVTGITALNTLTFANASGATAPPITTNIGFYVVWLDSQGPNTIRVGSLAPPV